MTNSTDVVSYQLADGVATITMDDGKANVMSLAMLGALGSAVDQAAADDAVIVLTGRGSIFSAGYDLALFQLSPDEIVATLRAGGELVARMLAHPLPIVAAVHGHAIAQGAFVMLACDLRLGVDADVRIGLNEVMIGLTIPHYGVEVARHQLAPAWFDHATLTGTLFPPATARAAGFLHELVEAPKLPGVARERAVALTEVDRTAHAGTKLRTRRIVIDAVRSGVADEFPTTDAESA